MGGFPEMVNGAESQQVIKGGSQPAGLLVPFEELPIPFDGSRLQHPGIREGEQGIPGDGGRKLVAVPCFGVKRQTFDFLKGVSGGGILNRPPARGQRCAPVYDPPVVPVIVMVHSGKQGGQ